MTSAQRARLRTFPYLLRALIPLTLLVVLAVVLAWPRGSGEEAVTEIDPAPAIAQAQDRAPFTVLVPASSDPLALEGDWKATSTRIEEGSATGGPFSFRIGYVTPEGEYAMFLESDDAPAAVLATAGVTTGTSSETIEGQVWSRTETADRGETVLTRTDGGVTLLVTGSAGMDELRELAASLS